MCLGVRISQCIGVFCCYFYKGGLKREKSFFFLPEIQRNKHQINNLGEYILHFIFMREKTSRYKVIYQKSEIIISPPKTM